MNYIEENISEIKERIAKSAVKSGRKVEDITLVAISKTFPVEKIMMAYDAGLRIFGENRVQEALSKIEKLPSDCIWHLVGHLQTNKAKDALLNFRMIQSVDSVKLASRISRLCEKYERNCNLLLEVNTSGEKSKYGFKPDDFIPEFEKIIELPYLNIQGLMTIGPLTDNEKEIRKSFTQLREFFENIKSYKSDNVNPLYLSMGMTDDFEIAIEEGSNMIRIGRAIFGERKKCNVQNAK